MEQGGTALDSLPVHERASPASRLGLQQTLSAQPRTLQLCETLAKVRSFFEPWLSRVLGEHCEGRKRHMC